MADFIQQRHRPPIELGRARELVVACPPMRSNINLSRIVRTAGCCGIRRVICSGNARVIDKIARETGDGVSLENHRTLAPVLRRMRQEGFELIGLEQTTDSQSIFEFQFPRKALLVIGNERLGIKDQILKLLDQTVEIPVYGQPFSHNAATATAMALYEYCRQYPNG